MTNYGSLNGFNVIGSPQHLTGTNCTKIHEFKYTFSGADFSKLNTLNTVIFFSDFNPYQKKLFYYVTVSRKTAGDSPENFDPFLLI